LVDLRDVARSKTDQSGVVKAGPAKGTHKIAARFGVDAVTVQKISTNRPLANASAAA
jgi:hypothetical protein